jgi:crystallin alpha B
MSLLRYHPFYSGGDWFDFPTPERIFDQHFGDMMPFGSMMAVDPLYGRMPYWMRPRHVMRSTSAPNEGGVSEVQNTKDKFAIRLDVHHFKPEEITVKTAGQQVQIEAKHEEQMDEHGFVQRHFIRKYALPHGVEPETVVSSLSQDGLLTIEAPKKALEGETQERKVPIQMGQQAKEAVEGKQ